MRGNVRLSYDIILVHLPIRPLSCAGGKSGIWSGARTAGLLCTLVQLGFNEVGVMRIKFVSRKIQESQSPLPADIPALPTAFEDGPRLSIFDRLLGIIGFRKLTDDEYIKVLKKQRNEALQRIAVLEQERREREESHEDPRETA